MTVQDFKTLATKELSQCSQTARLDAEVLLSFSLELSKTALLLQRDMQIPAEKEDWLTEALAKRKTGLPVAYITGHKEFYGYDFIVNQDVLIPKPDTEILVERAADSLAQKIDSRQNSLITVCDMCTGSGCIALSVLKTLLEVFKVPQERLPKFVLADISERALDVARLNAEALFGTESSLVKSRISFVRTNLFEALPFKFDVILTNPPYVPASMTTELLKDGRGEPRLALDGDITLHGEKSGTDDGLEVIRNLIPQIKEHIAPRGEVFMECGEYNAKKAAAFAESHGFKSTIHKDLEGQLRVVELHP